jgi:tol-pal system protein YbgF
MYPKRLLLLCGLVVATSPLSFPASAQGGYVDLEAEAAVREASGQSSEPSSGQATGSSPVPADPYGAAPASTYPSTSYGVQTASTVSANTAPAVSQGAQGPPGSMGNLVLQVQQLQQEVMRLNGQVEEQAHELRTLKEQSLQRYIDLDKRLSGGASTTTGASTATVPPVSATAVSRPPSSSGTTGASQPGEKSAYDAAYGLVVGKQFEQAIPAFRQFLQDFPEGRYAPNAHYWLGELFLVLSPPDLESARQSFALLISEYPEHSKVPDALYKLGKVQFLKGNREKAREYLDLVVAQYSASGSAVVKLARDFIAENY